MREIYTTGVPVPFEVAYSARVPDCGKLERVLHKVFDDKRVRPDREFFTANPELARLIIDLVKVEDRPLSDEEQGITPDQRTEIEVEKERSSQRLSFDRLGLRPGTVLRLYKDPSVTCEGAGANKVSFKAQIMSPSGAALQALRDLGFAWTAASGSDHWTHEGVRLSALTPLDQGGEPSGD